MTSHPCGIGPARSPQTIYERPCLTLPTIGMELDFGGFVKEYAADRVAELCREAGVTSGLIDLGGDLAVIGPHPDGSPWLVGVRNPRCPEESIARIAIDRGGLATSGDYERFMIVDGKRYSKVTRLPRAIEPHAKFTTEPLFESVLGIYGQAIRGKRQPFVNVRPPNRNLWTKDIEDKSLNIFGAHIISPGKPGTCSCTSIKSDTGAWAGAVLNPACQIFAIKMWLAGRQYQLQQILFKVVGQVEIKDLGAGRAQLLNAEP